MVAEVIEHLQPSRGGVFIDGTVGLGGHARALLDAGASQLLGIDRDPAAVTLARERLRDFGDRARVVHGDYRDLPAILDREGVGAVDGILLDLGVSSMQLDEPGRGFSFRRDEPLDMRMDTSAGATAAEAVAGADEKTLADVIYELGEDRHARRIARAIVAARARAPITTTGQLADVVRRAVPKRGYSRIDPATRTFQAVRIWVNRELDGLGDCVAAAAARLAPGGRLVVISFHSLEDRIVKHVLRSMQAAGAHGLRVLTKRPLVPGAAETERNPRARSAKLRAAEVRAVDGPETARLVGVSA
jgi:16S rRNA (cytosine1402-N4)-methyltransferase